MTPLALWFGLNLFTVGALSTTVYRQWRQIRDYQGLMSAATKELRECERVIGEASQAIRRMQ